MKKLASRKDLRVIDLMIAFGPLGYGIYALLVDYLKERKALRRVDDIGRIAYELHADADMLRSVIEDFGLFTVDNEGIISATGSGKSQTAVRADATEPADDSSSEAGDKPYEKPVAETGDRPEPAVAAPVVTPAMPHLTSSQKRRERRRRLKFTGKQTPAALLYKQE